MVNFAVPELNNAYDHIISDLKVTSPSSHEFILLYDIFVPKKSFTFTKIFLILNLRLMKKIYLLLF
jgi:hypothetical protein